MRIPSSLHPFGGQDVWQLLEQRCTASPHATAFVWHPFEGPQRSWTFRELRDQAAAVGGGLGRRGIGAGDNVVIHLENCPEFVVTWFACASIGAVAVTTNTRSAPAELAYFLDRCDAAAVVTQPRLAQLLEHCVDTALPTIVTDHDAGVPAGPLAVNRAEPFRSLAEEAAPPGRAGPPDPTRPMSVQFTSGTTDRPKGVVWTHGNALWAAQQNALRQDLRPTDCFLCYLPLFHMNALAITMLPCLWAGARFVLVPKWSTSRFADLSVRYRCTHLNLIGLTGGVLLEHGLPAGHSYRVLGAGLCDLGWDQPFGVKSLGWWGMTETVSLPIVGDVHAPNRHASIGRPSAGYEIRVVDDDGREVAPDGTGHLLVRGTPGLSLFAGYLNDDDATAAAFDDDGWFRTGDLVTRHDDGYLTFADRAKDVLRVGAENVSAAEVERVLLEVPGVLEAAVVGRPDPKLDEVPVAFVRVGEAVAGLEEEAVAHTRDRLADFKVPRAVYQVRELPRSTLSKVSKVALRAVADPGADRAQAEREWITARSTDPSGNAG